MIAKDYHSLWLNSAALALAGGDLEVEGGVVERDARGEPTGVLREEAAWRFQARHLRRARTTSTSTRCARAEARGARAASRRCTTRTAGSARSGSGSGSKRDGALTLRVWQSLPHDRLDELRALGDPRPASAARCCGSAT